MRHCIRTHCKSAVASKMAFFAIEKMKLYDTTHTIGVFKHIRYINILLWFNPHVRCLNMMDNQKKLVEFPMATRTD